MTIILLLRISQNLPDTTENRPCNVFRRAYFRQNLRRACWRLGNRNEPADDNHHNRHGHRNRNPNHRTVADAEQT